MKNYTTNCNWDGILTYPFGFSPLIHFMDIRCYVELARPVNTVPNIPGIPGPPVGGASSGSSSPSGYTLHSEAKMVRPSVVLSSFCRLLAKHFIYINKRMTFIKLLHDLGVVSVFLAVEGSSNSSGPRSTR